MLFSSDPMYAFSTICLHTWTMCVEKLKFFGEYVGVSMGEYTCDCRWVITCTLFPHIVALALLLLSQFSNVEMGAEVNTKTERVWIL